MLILAQNKEMLINIENANIVYVLNGSIYAEDGRDDCRWSLGAYESEERAKAILEEIIDKYEKFIFSEGGPLITRDAYVQPIAYTPPKTYKMPEE